MTRDTGKNLHSGGDLFAENLLRTEGHFAESLIEVAPVIFLVLDKEGRIVRFNPYMEEISGYLLKEVRGKDWFSTFLPTRDHNQIREVFKKALGDIQTRGNINPIVTKDGRERLIEWYDKTLRDKEGRVLGIVSFGQDITERKQAEEKLQQSETRLRSVFESKLIGMLFWNADGDITDANQSFLDMVGYSREEVLSGEVSWRDMTPPEYVEQDDIALREVTETGGMPPIEKEYVCKDGSRIPVLLGAASLPGTVPGGVAFVLDIRERKWALDALLDSEALLKEAQSVGQMGHWELDSVSGTPVWSEEIFHIFGLDPAEEEPSFAAHSEIIHPEDWPLLNNAITRLSTTGISFDIQFRLIRTDKQLRWMHARGSVSRNESGEIIRMFGTAQDITHIRQTDEELRKFRTIADKAVHGVALSDPQGNLTYVNNYFAELHGYTSDELVGRNLSVFHNDEQLDHVRQLLDQLMEDDSFDSREVWHSHKDGSVFPTLMNGVVIRDERGKPQYLAATAINIAEQKKAQLEKQKLEGQLRQSQKMEAVGTLAGGIAHDFNNILGIIAGYTELATLDAAEGTKLRENLERVLGAVRRGGTLASQILTFSRQEDQKRKPIDIIPLIREVIKLVRASMPTTIEIRHDLQVDSGMILGDSTQIHQVLLNLCTNAKHAMAEASGILAIELCEERYCDDDLLNYPEMSPGTYLKLAVSDTGCGMNKETMGRIFEPYFTTKPLDEGTGLGLSVVHGIVAGHEGVIRAYSEPGKGTTFQVLLPKFDGDAASAPQVVELLGNTKPACILFVDDEEGLVDYGKQMLEHLGHEVISRMSSVEALETFRLQPDRFDLVITDMTMPELTGVMLSREMLTIRPDIPIILCTGFSESISSDKARTAGIRELLMKPVLIRDLNDAIRRAFEDQKE